MLLRLPSATQGIPKQVLVNKSPKDRTLYNTSLSISDLRGVVINKLIYIVHMKDVEQTIKGEIMGYNITLLHGAMQV